MKIGDKVRVLSNKYHQYFKEGDTAFINDIDYDGDVWIGGLCFDKNELEEIIEQEPQSNLDTTEDFQAAFELHNKSQVKGSDKLTGEEIADIVEKKVRVFETGSKRDADDHKPLPFELNPYMLLRYGYHMKRGSLNYGHGNWEMQQPDIAILQSMSRHFTQLYFNYKFPELAKHTDDGTDHASAILFGLNMLLHNECIAGVPADKFFNKANQDEKN